MTKDSTIIAALKMTNEILYKTMIQSENQAIRSKIGSINKQISNLIEEIDIVQPRQLTPPSKPIKHPPGKKKNTKKKIHMAHQGRNASRVSVTHNAQGVFKYGVAKGTNRYQIKDFND